MEVSKNNKSPLAVRSCSSRPGNIDFVRDINVLWGQTLLDIVALNWPGLDLDDVIGIVRRGRKDGRNGPLIAWHERDLGPVHRGLLAVERLVRFGRRTRLHRPARGRLIAATRVVVGGEDAVDIEE